MTLMQIAEAQRHGKETSQDTVLKVPLAILTLQERIEEKQTDIKELCIFGVSSETGEPQALGFSNQGEAEKLQGDIAKLTREKEGLTAIYGAIEEIYESYGVVPCSMQQLSERISEVHNRPTAIAFKINGMVRRLMDDNRAITLAEIWSNPEIMALETERGRLILAGDQEATILIALKDELIALVNKEVDAMVAAVRRPGREINPASVAAMEGDYDTLLSESEEEEELNRMEAGLV
jgi:hypothetical protein